MEILSRTTKLNFKLTPHSLTFALKVVTIFIVPMLLLRQDLFSIFGDAIRDETSSYILTIPFLIAYILYRKRKVVKAAISESSRALHGFIPLDLTLGVLLLSLSIVLYWYGSYTFTPIEFHIFTLPVLISACILILFNISTLRHVFFPILLLFFLVPIPAEILYYLGGAFSTFSSEIAYSMLAPIFPMSLAYNQGSPVILMNLANGTSASFIVDVACSGIYSQIGFIIAALFTAYLVRDKISKKAAIFLLGIPLVFFLNVFRIVLILLIGYYFGTTLAFNVFHLLGGWVLIFVGTFILFAILQKILNIQILGGKQGPNLEVESGSLSATMGPENSSVRTGMRRLVNKKDLIKLLAVFLSVLVLTSIQAPVFALTKGPAEVTIQDIQGDQASISLLPSIPNYDLHFLRRNQSFETKSGQDASLEYVYYPRDSDVHTIYVGIEITSTRTLLHRWETCLVNWPVTHGNQLQVTQIESTDIELNPNPPIIGRYFIFQWTQGENKGLNQSVLYWYETATFKTNSSSEFKYAKISLVTFPENLEETPEIKSQLYNAALEIIGYWQPIKGWSMLALSLSQNGGKLALIILLVSMTFAAIYYLDTRRQKQRNANAYKKLPTMKKQIVDSIRRTRKETLPTLENIGNTYQSLTGKPVTHEALLQSMAEMEKMRLVTQDVANLHDEPVHIWRINLF